MDSLTKKQLGLLKKMSRLDPAPFIVGGYAEDALVLGSVSRPHVDVDWIWPRREMNLRLEQVKKLGFKEPETWGEAEPGKPFYLYAEHSNEKELTIDVAVYDEEDGATFFQIGKLYFDLDGKEAPVGYRVYLPKDTFDQPPVQIEGITVRPISPLALYQMRAGIAKQGSFGELSEKQQNSLKRLKDKFFPNETNESLLPRIEKLA